MKGFETKEKGEAKLDKVTVYLTGAEGNGWALDQDLITTRRTLELIPGIELVNDLKSAQVIHSVWEAPLLLNGTVGFEGKRIITHVCNDVPRTFEEPFMHRAAASVGMWVGISKRACDELSELGLPNTYIPYAIDNLIFQKGNALSDADRKLRKKELGIPEGRYVIANFMRDSSGAELTEPKVQKSPEVFLELAKELKRRKVPVHVLLAGPRRHWMIHALRECDIEYSYAGIESEVEDFAINCLSQQEIRELYDLIDVCVINSRWEGGPRCLLEACAVGCKVISTDVGMVRDILDPACIFSNHLEGADLLEADSKYGFLSEFVEVQRKMIEADFVPEANLPRFQQLYERLEEIQPLNQVVRKPEIERWKKRTLGRRPNQWKNYIKSFFTPDLKVSVLESEQDHTIIGSPLWNELTSNGVALNTFSKMTKADVCWFRGRIELSVEDWNHLGSTPIIWEWFDFDGIPDSQLLEKESIVWIVPDYAVLRNIAQKTERYPSILIVRQTHEQDTQKQISSVEGNAVNIVIPPGWEKSNTDDKSLEYLVDMFSSLEEEFKVFICSENLPESDLFEYYEISAFEKVLSASNLVLTLNSDIGNVNSIVLAMASGKPILYRENPTLRRMVEYGGMSYPMLDKLADHFKRIIPNLEAFAHCGHLIDVKSTAVRLHEIAEREASSENREK